jgi:molybdenum cofactor biosynthesis protein B
MSSSSEKHRREAERLIGSPVFGLLVISSSRYYAFSRGESVTDESGDLAQKILEANGYKVGSRLLVNDDVHIIRFNVLKQLFEAGCDACVTVGGTGVSPRDLTVEAVRPLLDKELSGFPEILRVESFKKIGGASMMTRALAGVINGKVVVCLPGSPDSVETGLTLILVELKHLMRIARQNSVS